jgi:hypothetical protein
VSAFAATGTVTFYDGISALETEPVSNGQATFSTVMLASGLRTLKAHYSGDSIYAPSTSAATAQTVTALPQNGFQNELFSNGLPSGSCCSPIATGDFNGDGKPDLALVDSDSINILLGNGDGTFQWTGRAVDYYVPASVVVADFNSDGLPDVAVVNLESSFVSVYLTGTNGTIGAPLNLSEAPGSFFGESLLAADFNGDGHVDLAVLNYGGVNVLFGNGDGTFQAPLVYSAGNSTALAFTAGDFNNDGKPDIALSLFSLGVQILLGNGDGTFQAQPLTPFPAADELGTLVAGDLNGDGNPDLAIGYSSNVQSGTAVMLGKGDGAFQTPVFYPAVSESSEGSVLLGDFNGDGVADIANFELGFSGSAVEVLLGNGDGTFQPAVTVTVATDNIAVADFNGDGRTDLALTSFPLGVLLGESVPVCAALVPAPIIIDASGAQTSLAITVSSGPCAWSAAGPTWVAFEPASGTESTAVTATIPPNTSGVDLSGNIDISIAGRLAYLIPVTERSTAEVFSDVPPNDYYFDAANLLFAKGITNGCSSNPLDFCPTQDVTRAEMAIFIVRSIFGGDHFTAPTTPYFNDVGPTDFGFAWIQEMAALGITNGCGNNDFCPQDDVTRAEMAIFIIRARYGATANPDYSLTPFFTDVPANTFGFSSIQRMKMDNITSGCTATTYCPAEAVTRGDMAIFVMRGGYNQLLPAGEPVISQISPASIPPGQLTTVAVTGVNTNFGAGTTVNPIPGVAVGAVTVTSPTSFTVDLTPAANSPIMPFSVWVTTGTEEAVLPNGLTLQ